MKSQCLNKHRAPTPPITMMSRWGRTVSWCFLSGRCSRPRSTAPAFVPKFGRDISRPSQCFVLTQRAASLWSGRTIPRGTRNNINVVEGAPWDFTFMGLYLSPAQNTPKTKPFIIVIGGAGGRNRSSHSWSMGVYLSRHGPEQNKKKQTNNVK